MKSILDVILVRDNHVCPWWFCFTFDNPIRKLFHHPIKILSPYLKPGFTVIDIGPGMGYFSIPMCGLVGEKGRVIAIDIQQKMLNALLKRAQQKGVSDRLTVHLSTPEEFGISEKADFILAFWMVHEVPNKEHFFKETAELMRPEGKFLFVEPNLHVTKKRFDKTIQTAVGVGFKIGERPKIAFSRSALLTLT